jgi:RNA methyltransferase, TrmH family
MITKKIESLQHPIVKHLVKLRENHSWREETKRVLIIGKKMVTEVAKTTPLLNLFISSPSLFFEDLRPSTLYETSLSLMKKITGQKEPEGIAAEVLLPLSQDLSNKKFLLVLDRISDPGNMGTLLRTALALEWDGAILLEGCVDPFHEKAIRASMGASFFLPLAYFQEKDLENFLLSKKFHCYLADIEGEDLHNLSFQFPLALFLCSESLGPSLFAERVCQKVTIPMKKKVDSLNVAVAGGILMYQMKLL